jgi:phospholipid/cholesterol/gamma-HCH transport system substrate-binding protein
VIAGALPVAGLFSGAFPHIIPAIIGVIMALPFPKVSLRGGNVFETILSALVILVAIGFLVFIFVRTGTGHLGSYSLRIRMADASGLTVGSDVRLGGTKIGSVTDLWLDKSDFSAVIKADIRDDLSLPLDSRASVATSTLSNPYLSIAPGNAAKTVGPGGEIGAGRHK